MDQTVIAILKTLRPRQWLKNLTIFAGLIFTQRIFIPGTTLFDWLSIYITILAFIMFCLAASAIYIFNDIVDAPKDRLHPFKRKRPIAAGKLSPQLAVFFGLTILIISLVYSFLLSPRFFFAVAAYVLLQLAYMFYLKHIIILDVLAIAAGFILRIYAGIWVIGTHLSIWFLLCIVSFALFIAVGKRRAEATLLSGVDETHDVARVRATLGHYPEALLHSYTTMFATATWVTYSLFAFLQPTITPNSFFRQFFYNLSPRSDTKWLMGTIPFVIFGVMRYLYLIYERKEGESPERVFLSDRPLLFAVTIWGILVMLILYVIPA
jgi:4-hydroxybenzoate polyprenyltransferase